MKTFLVWLASLATFAKAIDYFTFATTMATTGPLEQRDGLSFNIALYNSTKEHISDLYLCNTCQFSYIFSDGPY